MQQSSSPRIIMLCVPCEPSNILYHALEKEYGVTQVLYEDKESAKTILKRRIKKLGWWKVFGQLLFQLSIQKILQRAVPARLKELEKDLLVNAAAIPEEKVIKVSSANDQQTINQIIALKPDLLVINGTRILSKHFLATVPCAVINVHAGITPCYRGVHGAYWALVNQDKAHCGVTVHLVDTGIATGGILAQSLIQPKPHDHFSTYPVLQFSVAVPILLGSIDKVLKKQHTLLSAPDCRSGLWYHPTLWQYVYYRVVRKVK